MEELEGFPIIKAEMIEVGVAVLSWYFNVFVLRREYKRWYCAWLKSVHHILDGCNIDQ